MPNIREMDILVSVQVFVLGCVFVAWKRRKQLEAWFMKLRVKDEGAFSLRSYPQPPMVVWF